MISIFVMQFLELVRKNTYIDICTSYISELPKKSLTPAVGVCAVIPASHALMSQAVMKKSRPIKRAEAGVPTGKT